MKKFITYLLVLVMWIAIMPISRVNATSTADTSQATDVQDFIKAIKKNEGQSFDKKKIISTTLDPKSNQTTIVASNPDKSFTVYSSISKEDTNFLVANPSKKLVEARGYIRTLVSIITKIYSGGKFVCKVVKNISGTNICGAIGDALLKNMTPGKEYKATAVLVKDPDCEPMYSYQCNIPPYVYWETTIVPA